jgi:serine/threonine-protein kinase
MKPRLDSDHDLSVGDIVGEYRLEGALGRGGFGVVYGGEHPLIGKKVAIKVLNRRFSADPDIVSRFVDEARAVNQIRHQHIIDIFSFGQLPDGRQYYVMELLAGDTLDKIIKERGRLEPAEALAILRPIARARDAAHAAGIAHRDLKAENVFIARDSEGKPFPKLLDFGVAKLLGPENETPHRTATGAPIGTPLYMSPEQARGRGVDHRTDIYAFGVLSYLILTGELPFTGPDYLDILNQQISAQPMPPSQRCADLPPTVDTAIGAMMAKKPDDRPPTLIDAMKSLAEALGASSLEMRALEAAQSTRRAPVRVDPLGETHATPPMASTIAATITETGVGQAPRAKVKPSRAPLAIGGIVVAAAAVVAVVLIATNDPDRAAPAAAPDAALPPAKAAVPPPDAAPAAVAPDAAPAAAPPDAAVTSPTPPPRKKPPPKKPPKKKPTLSDEIGDF